MMLIMAINLTATLIFIVSKHPLSMGATLLVQTLMISLLIGNYSLNFWFSYILFLIMVGGMLILFIYMTSVASNEKFKMNYKLVLPILGVPSILLLIPIDLVNNNNFYTMESINKGDIKMFNQLIMKFMNYPSSLILMFIMIYLLITLIAVVKITNIKYGPLRMMN